jgi:hypothetical protein
MSVSPLSLDAFERALSPAEAVQLAALTSPMAIQEFLDAVPYSTEDRYRAPLTVLRERGAHCFDGACFAALALARLGQPALLVDLLPWDDDDHVLAVFRRGARYGAVAKSNFVGLRYREPVYASLRELVMSYFEHYFNVAGTRTLRGHTELVDLAALDALGWGVNDHAMDQIADALDAAPRVQLFSDEELRAFTRVDRLTYEADLAHADAAGLYTPQGA